MTPPDDLKDGFPPKIAQPARRALLGAGYTHLEQLTAATKGQLMALHGMGPKALSELERALAARGLTFAEETPPTGE